MGRSHIWRVPIPPVALAAEISSLVFLRLSSKARTNTSAQSTLVGDLIAGTFIKPSGASSEVRVHRVARHQHRRYSFVSVLPLHSGNCRKERSARSEFGRRVTIGNCSAKPGARI